MSKQKFDDRRGDAGLGGYWINAKEAKDISKQHENHEGHEWWKFLELDGKNVEVKQYVRGAPRDRPFWAYENGDMYLGQWSRQKKEEGVGITYNNNPKGLICISEWKGGFLDGKGKSSWLQDSKIWLDNKYPDSPIFEKEHGGKTVPFTYDGEYVNSVKVAKNATVTLKNGIAKVGPWKEGKPKGNWWKDHNTLKRNAGNAREKRTSTRKRTTQENENIRTNTKKSRKKMVPVKKEDDDEFNVSPNDCNSPVSSTSKQVKKKVSSSTSRNDNASRRSNSSRSSAAMSTAQTAATHTAHTATRVVPTTTQTTNQGERIGVIETMERAVDLEPAREVGALLRLSRLEQRVFGDVTLDVLVGIVPRVERLQKKLQEILGEF